MPSVRNRTRVEDLSWLSGFAYAVVVAVAGADRVAPRDVEALRHRVSVFLSDATSSAWALRYNAVLIGALIGSIATTFLETTTREGHNFPQRLTSTGSARIFRACEATWTGVFTLDFLLRLLVCKRLLPARPNREAQPSGASAPTYAFHQFSSIAHLVEVPWVSDWRNWVDFVAIAPLYVSLAVGGAATFPKYLGVLRLLRFFKITGSYTATQVLAVTAMNVAKPLVLPTFFLALSALLAGSLIFVLEPCTLAPVCSFASLWEAVYFVLVSMTTVGYGDMVPVDPWARAVTVVVLLCGALFLSMPIAIIGIDPGGTKKGWPTSKACLSVVFRSFFSAEFSDERSSLGEAVSKRE